MNEIASKLLGELLKDGSIGRRMPLSEKNDMLADIINLIEVAWDHGYNLKKGSSKTEIDIQQDWEIVLGCLDDTLYELKRFSEMINGERGTIQ
jgi:hypothetical protein